MTATDTSFVATGWPGRIGPGSPAANVGFYASAQPLGRATHPFQFGAFAVGYQAGIYGATDDVGPPANTTWDEAAVVGTSNNKHGVFGISSTRYGVMGQRGVKTTHAIPPPAAGVMGLSQDAHGVVGVSDSGNGVKGESYQAAGVSAYSFSSVGVDAVTEVGPAGIFGRAVGSGNGVTGIAATNAGVFGVTEPAGPTVPNLTNVVGVNVAGVVGSSDQQPGVIGTSKFVGVYGYCGTPDPMTAAGNGVEGHSEDGNGVVGVAGAEGPAPANIAGVVGTSDARAGVIGTSNGAAGVAAFSSGSHGLFAQTTKSGAYAGYFAGDLFVTGQIFAGIKDAIVPFADGTHRLLHCMESPEHWFEDFGAGKLKRGRAVVKLDANFAKVIKRGDYKVFVTPEGDCRGLYVRKRGASFEVRELASGRSSVAFSYRIVGRRKDIRDHKRFAKIDVKLPVFAGGRRPLRGKLLGGTRKQAGAMPARRRQRRRGKRA